MRPRKHGEAHGPSTKATPEYRAWVNMKERCKGRGTAADKNYRDRGIKVCNKWRHNFVAFLADIGRKPSAELTLERINNDKGYGPTNCRWATRHEQMQNTRRTNKKEKT